MLQMLLPQFAKQFKTQLVELEKENNATFRLTLESLPMLQEDMESIKHRIFLRIWKKDETMEGCVNEVPFSSMVNEALSNPQVQMVLAMLPEEINVNSFLENYFVENQTENKADRFLFMMSLVDSKNKITRKVSRKGIFQMLVQTGSQFKVLQKFEV